jgi:hypothetical protein
MKKLVLAGLLLLCSLSVMAQTTPSVGPNGIAVPNFTETNRLALSSPATGLVVYQTDGTTGYYVYTGVAWVRLLDSNLSLGTMSTQAASAVAVTGGTIDGSSIGATTASTGAFTTLSASSTLGVAGHTTLTNTGTASELRLNEPSGSGTNYTAFKTAAQAANVTYTLPTADGTSGQVLSTDGSGILSWATASGGLSNFTESNYTYSSKTGVKFLATNAETNVDLVLQPKGTGSILAQEPDGTETGGDNRGVNSVDLQTVRSSSVDVASGYRSTISGGSGNRASSGFSTVSGGSGNSATNAYSTVSGGSGNTASSTFTTISGGALNTASSGYSTVSGGNSNTASNTFSTVSGGSSNTASATYSVVSGGESNSSSGGYSNVSGGNSNTASNTYSTVLGGGSNTASGHSSAVLGGYSNTASAQTSTVLGGQSNTSSGQYSITSGIGNTAASYGEIVLGSYALTQSGTSGSIVTTDRLFAIGNGSADGSRSSALTILKNGNTTIGGTLTVGDAYTLPAADGTSGQVLSTDGSGTLSWSTVSGSGATTIDGLTDAKSGGTDFTNSILLGSQTTGTLSAASGNVGIGGSVFSTLTSGNQNTAVGYAALTSLTSGASNNAIGYNALYANTTGSNNIAIGDNALGQNTTGIENVAIGTYAFSNNLTGNYNTAIGSGAELSGVIENSTAIGYSATVDASNTIQLGNENVTSVKTSGTISAGDVTYPNTHGTNGQVLTTNGSGTLSWATSSATVADASLTSAKFYARTLSSNTTLTASDFMIIANGAITITLPSSPVDGQVYMIGTTNSGTTISSSKTIYYNLNSTATSVTFASFYSNFVYLIYSSTLNAWMVSSAVSPVG